MICIQYTTYLHSICFEGILRIMTTGFRRPNSVIKKKLWEQKPSSTEKIKAAGRAVSLVAITWTQRLELSESQSVEPRLNEILGLQLQHLACFNFQIA